MAFTSDKKIKALPDVEDWCDSHRKVGLPRGYKRKGLKITHFETPVVKNEVEEFVIKCRACGHRRTENVEYGTPELGRCRMCGERHEYIVKS